MGTMPKMGGTAADKYLFFSGERGNMGRYLLSDFCTYVSLMASAFTCLLTAESNTESEFARPNTISLESATEHSRSGDSRNAGVEPQVSPTPAALRRSSKRAEGGAAWTVGLVRSGRAKGEPRPTAGPV